jgi:cytochrome c biogenesis protein CcdA
MIMRLVPASVRGERAFVLLWGSILGFACLLEVSVIELGVLGTVSGTVATATAAAAALGAAVMTAFAAGASVPVIVASAGVAAYVDRVRTEERLVSLRVTASLMMVVMGLVLLLRYSLLLAALA